MIFVTVGTTNNPFNRLSKELQALVMHHGYDQSNFIIQTGNTNFSSVFKNQSKFFDQNDFSNHITNCDLVISHAGVGSLMQCLIKNKTVIACPRYPDFDEHVDSHQVEFTEMLSKLKYCLVYRRTESLVDLIDIAHTFRSKYNERNDILQYFNSVLLPMFEK